jgi:hypothetical protein
MQLVEIVTRVSDLPWFVAKPSDCLKDGLEVPALFLFGIGVVKPAIRKRSV